MYNFQSAAQVHLCQYPVMEQIPYKFTYPIRLRNNPYSIMPSQVCENSQMKSLEVFSLHKQTTQMKSDPRICDCKYLYDNTAFIAA